LMRRLRMHLKKIKHSFHTFSSIAALDFCFENPEMVEG
jgi:hypothetical protein